MPSGTTVSGRPTQARLVWHPAVLGPQRAIGAPVKIQQVSVLAIGGLRSVCQCVRGKSATNRAFFRVGLGTLPSIKSQSIFFNEQQLARKKAGSTRPGRKLIQVQVRVITMFSTSVYFYSILQGFYASWLKGLISLPFFGESIWLSSAILGCKEDCNPSERLERHATLCVKINSSL